MEFMKQFNGDVWRVDIIARLLEILSELFLHFLIKLSKLVVMEFMKNLEGSDTGYLVSGSAQQFKLTRIDWTLIQLMMRQLRGTFVEKPQGTRTHVILMRHRVHPCLQIRYVWIRSGVFVAAPQDKNKMWQHRVHLVVQLPSYLSRSQAVLSRSRAVLSQSRPVRIWFTIWPLEHKYMGHLEAPGRHYEYSHTCVPGLSLPTTHILFCLHCTLSPALCRPHEIETVVVYRWYADHMHRPSLQ